KVNVTGIPAATDGVYKLDNVALAVNDVISVADLNLNKLVFTPAANKTGATLGGLGFKVQDDGGTANDGADTDPVANTLNFTITSVNDAPVNTLPSSYSTVANTNLALSGLSIADVDAASGTVTVELNVATGTLAATTAGSVTVANSGTSTITLQGTLANINTYLAGASAPVFSPATGSTGDVLLTITTNDGGNTGTDPGLTGDESSEEDIDTVTISVTPPSAVSVTLTGDASVAEGASASYTVTLGQAALSNMDVQVVTGHTTTDNGDLLPTTMTVTIAAGTTSKVFTVANNDDVYAEGNEAYTVKLNGTTTGGGFESTNVNTTPVNTVINDDSGTPNIPGDSPEPNHESVQIKLVALDANGNPLFAKDEITYLLANDVTEGGTGKYMALAFEPSAGVFTSATKLANQTGSVTVNFANGTATGASSQTAFNGSQDFNNSRQTGVALGSVISAATFDDYLSDNNETFTVALAAGSYLPATGGYENVALDSGVVTGTINDEATAALEDTVYVRLTGNDSTDEAAGATLDHLLSLVDKDGNAVTLATGKSVTVTLAYTSDTTNAADFTAPKITSVTLTGSSTGNVINTVADDFLKEAVESYTLSIDSVSDDNGSFEALEIDSVNTVIGTITDTAAELDHEIALVSISGTQSIVEGTTSTAYTVSVDQPASDVTAPITVALNYTGVAQDGKDFSGVASVTIPAGSNSATFTIA
ncbi:MAG: hypothetical protein QX203_08765, partial [Methylococcaceae bacterium]